jgi:hypothetical protein
MFTDRGGETVRETAQQARTAIPRVASLAICPDRLERMWAMTPQERLHAAESGQPSLGEMLRWAAGGRTRCRSSTASSSSSPP